MIKRFGKLNYLEKRPEHFEETGKYPLIIHIHGAGSRGDDVQILNGQAIMHYRESVSDFPFVVLMPQCYADSWFDIFEQLQAFVEMAAALPYVDQDRIYLSGVSMGGYASWQLLMSKPNVFKKAVVCCGGGMYWNAGRIKTPVWAFHGTDDPTVFFEESQKMVNAVNRNGGNAKLTKYEGVEHNCWDLTYHNPEVYAWLLSEDE